MSVLFHEKVSNEDIARVFAEMAAAPRHIFQVLTKRAERMRRWFEWAAEDGPPVDGWPLPNVWIGVSVEDQETAEERLYRLVRTPAAVRFVSAEPLLAPVDLTPWLHGIGWVIVGGESGHGARPFQPSWAADIVRQCRSHGIPVFVKQLGSRWARQEGARDSKGGDLRDFPAHLRIREFPTTKGSTP